MLGGLPVAPPNLRHTPWVLSRNPKHRRRCLTATARVCVLRAQLLPALQHTPPLALGFPQIAQLLACGARRARLPVERG